MSIRKIISRNIIFILIIMALFGAFAVRERSITIPIVSTPDIFVDISAEQTVEQMWQSNVKKITGIAIAYQCEEGFVADINLVVKHVLTDVIIAESNQMISFESTEDGQIIVPLNDIKLQPGQQYSILFELNSDENVSGLRLEAGQNHSGCKIDGEELNCGLGLVINGVKTNSISYLVLVLFPFFALAFFYMVVFDRKFEETIGVAFLTPFTLMFLAGMMDWLKISLYLAYGISIFAFGYGIYSYNKKEKGIKDLLSPGLVCYFVLLVFIIINCESLVLSRSDEFTHWGLATKDMFYFDNFCMHKEYLPMATFHYPPYLPLIQYFFVYINGFVSDTFMYLGYQMAVISCLIVVCSKSKNRWSSVLASVTVTFSMMLLFYNEVFSTIYVDAVLTVFVIYVLVCYFAEERSFFNWIRILLGMVAIVYTKPTGAVLAGLIALMMLGDVILKERKISKDTIKKCIMPAVCVLTVVFLFFAWQQYLKTPLKDMRGRMQAQAVEESSENQSAETSNETEIKVVEKTTKRSVVSASGLSVGNIVNFIKGNGMEYQYTTFKEFGKDFLIGETYPLGNISLSYFEFLVLVSCFAWIVAVVFCDKEKAHAIGRYTLGAVLAGCAYAGFIMITYMFSFDAREAVLLSHHQRYLGTWLCAMAVALIAIVLAHANSEEDISKRKKWVIIEGLCILSLLIAPTVKLINRRVDEKNMQVYASGYQTVSEVARSFVFEGDRILYIYSGNETMDNRMFQYAMSPVKVDVMQLGENGITANLSKYDYVYVMNCADELNTFITEEQVQNTSFYQVESEEEQIKLVFIGEALVNGFV